MSGNLTASYTIIRNIDCTGVSFVPVGNASTAFSGTLNGGGYTIENLTINETGNSNIGLFGITNNATISDLNIEEATIHGASEVGTLVGDSLSADISSIRIHNTNITASGTNVGGVVGELGGSGLSSSSATSAFVTGGSDTGGLVGWAVGGTTVSDSFALATVTGGNDTGGLVGEFGGGPTVAENTYSTGNVDVTSGANVGGLMGYVSSGGETEVSDSFTTSAVSNGGAGATGGAFGNQLGSISDILFDPSATGQSNCVGGGSSSGCSTAAASSFKNSSSSAPMSSWDFSNTWKTQPTNYPELQPLFNWGPNDTPNNNDANDDGIDDSYEPNVNSVPSDTNVWSTITVPSSSNCDVENPAWAKPTNQDTGYTQELGTMTAFTLDCSQTGVTVPVTIIYDKQYNTSGWVLRYYNENTDKYSTVAGASFGTKTIGGVVKTTVTYDVTDGGSLDSDGTANGIIVDPVAPAISNAINLSSSAAPDTGYVQPNNSRPAAMAILASSTVLMLAGSAIFRTKFKRSPKS